MLHRAMLAIVRADGTCRRLMTVPGVGALVAITFTSAVDDPARFSRSRMLGAHQDWRPGSPERVPDQGRHASACPYQAEARSTEQRVGGEPAVVFPTYSRGERIADRCIHVVGLTAALIAIPALIAAAAHHGSVSLIVGLLLYGAGLLAMLGCSALYNFARPSPRKELFRRLDHAAIFVMIAGTYTPFTLNEIGGAWGIGLFAFVWLSAVGAAAMKLLRPRRFERAPIAPYLVLGWIILVALDPLLSAVSPPALILLVIGGLLYSVGVLFHLWRRLPYHNAIWHGFVLMGAACHYMAILDEMAREVL